jgi:hypothetical protein
MRVSILSINTANIGTGETAPIRIQSSVAFANAFVIFRCWKYFVTFTVGKNKTTQFMPSRNSSITTLVLAAPNFWY